MSVIRYSIHPFRLLALALSILIFDSCQLTQDKKTNGYLIKQSAQQNEKRYYEVADSTDTPSITIKYSLQELMGQNDYKGDSSFRQISRSYSYNNRTQYLRIEACDSLEAMCESALADGIRLRVRSATRNFEDQCYFWNRDWKKTNKNGAQGCIDVMRIVAMPGVSRHHWGTEVDIDGLGNSKKLASIENNKRYAWLKKNAAKFGYYQCYDSDSSRTGYQEETWHWSFYPLSEEMTRAMVYLMSYGDIPEFEGCEFAEEIQVIENYVLGVGEVPRLN